MASESLINSNFNIGLPAQPPENFQSPEGIAAASMIINSMQNLVRGLEQYGGFTQKDKNLWSMLSPSETIRKYNLGRLYVKTSVDLPANNFINLWNNGGVLTARKATSFDAGSGLPRKAMGYTTVASVSGDYTEVILGQGLAIINGVNPGQDIYLSTVAGLAATVPDTAVGHLEQNLGFGLGGSFVYIDIAMGSYVQY